MSPVSKKVVSHETPALGARSNGYYKGGGKRFDHEETWHSRVAAYFGRNPRHDPARQILAIRSCA